MSSEGLFDLSPRGKDGGGSGDAGSAGPRPAAPVPELAPNDLAVSVTRQVVISGPGEWTHLISGVDTLDLGLYVDWGNAWPGLEKKLSEGKKLAEGSQGILFEGIPGGPHLIYPSGKAPMYAYHIQAPEFHVFIARRESATKYPTVYVSILSKALWTIGVLKSVEIVEKFVHRLGGRIERRQVSRCDVCSDFLIPGGLSLDFMRACRVSRSETMLHHVQGDALETFYAGSKGAPIQVRIYDKAKEIAAGLGDKLWFLDVWKQKECKDIWRVEFQMRREFLKEMGVDVLASLIDRSGGIWKYLTEEWFSIRNLDDENSARRSVQLWWQAVQEVGSDFGQAMTIERDYGGGIAPMDWYISHAAGCVVGVAARLGADDLDSVLGFLADQMRKYWAAKDFESRYREERIRLGINDTPKGDES